MTAILVLLALWCLVLTYHVERVASTTEKALRGVTELINDLLDVITDDCESDDEQRRVEDAHTGAEGGED